MDTPHAPLFLAAVGGGVVALLLAAAVGRVLPMAEAADGDVVRAQRFEVVDAAGKTRAVLGVLADGSPGLWMYDAAEKTRAVLAVKTDGLTVLALLDAAGKERAVLGVHPDGSPALSLRDARGNVVRGVEP